MAATEVGKAVIAMALRDDTAQGRAAVVASAKETARAAAKAARDEELRIRRATAGQTDLRDVRDTLEMLKGGGKVAVFTELSRAVRAFSDEAVENIRKVREGVLSIGEAAAQSAEKLPLLGAPFAAGRAIRKMIGELTRDVEIFDKSALSGLLDVSTGGIVSAAQSEARQRQKEDEAEKRAASKIEGMLHVNEVMRKQAEMAKQFEERARLLGREIVGQEDPFARRQRELDERVGDEFNRLTKIIESSGTKSTLQNATIKLRDALDRNYVERSKELDREFAEHLANREREVQRAASDEWDAAIKVQEDVANDIAKRTVDAAKQASDEWDESIARQQAQADERANLIRDIAGRNPAATDNRFGLQEDRLLTGVSQRQGVRDMQEAQAKHAAKMAELQQKSLTELQAIKRKLDGLPDIGVAGAR